MFGFIKFMLFALCLVPIGIKVIKYSRIPEKERPEASSVFWRWGLITLAGWFVLYLLLFFIPWLYANWCWFDHEGYLVKFWKDIKWYLLFLLLGSPSVVLFWLLVRHAHWLELPSLEELGKRKDLQEKFRRDQWKHDMSITKENYAKWLQQEYLDKWTWPSRWLGRAEITAIAVAGLIFTHQFASDWQIFVKGFLAVDVGMTEPIFGKDAAFYMFCLPAISKLLLHLLALMGMCVVLRVGSQAICFNLMRALEGQEKAKELFCKTLRTWWFIAAAATFIGAFAVWFGRYSLNFAEYGVITGASYLHEHAYLHAFRLTAVMLVALGVVLILLGVGKLRIRAEESCLRRWIFSAVACLVVLCLIWLAYPKLKERGRLDNDAKTLQLPYAKTHMQFTNFGFGMQDRQVHDVVPRRDITLEEILADRGTYENLRISDLESNFKVIIEQQTHKDFYHFTNVTFDRYEDSENRLRHLVVAPRLLNFAGLSQDGEEVPWVNRVLVYVSGYAGVVFPAYEMTEMGFPKLLMEGIPCKSIMPGVNFEPNSEKLRILFSDGLPSDYVIVNTKEPELLWVNKDGKDFKTHYSGDGGVRIGSGLRRLFLALHFKEGWNIWVSPKLYPRSRLMWRRDITERINTLAPFLRLDHDEYTVLRPDGSFFSILDCYTHSDKLPYSKQIGGDNPCRYLRNSVKAVIDSYTGKTDLFVVDPNCPIIKVYQKIYPGLLKPASEMPEYVRQHIRYPEDYFSVQTDLLCRYHPTDPDQFFRESALWEVAKEMYQKEVAIRMKPMTKVLTLPGQSREEFVMTRDFTPQQQDLATAWVVGRSDAEHYGELHVYKFTGGRSISGPLLADGKLSAQYPGSFTLWDQAGSLVNRGKTNTALIAGGYFLIEAVYVTSTGEAGLPKLRRVAVVYGDRIAWDVNKEKAFRRLYGLESGPIIDSDGGSVSLGLQGQGVPAGAVTNLLASPAGADVLEQIAHYIDLYTQLSGQGKMAEAGAAFDELRAVVMEALRAQAGEKELPENK